MVRPDRKEWIDTILESILKAHMPLDEENSAIDALFNAFESTIDSRAKALRARGMHYDSEGINACMELAFIDEE